MPTCTTSDTDGDQTPNHLDLDSDGDGVLNAQNAPQGRFAAQNLRRLRAAFSVFRPAVDNPEVRVPVITYLLHRLEELIDGRPLIYVMDEFSEHTHTSECGLVTAPSPQKPSATSMVIQLKAPPVDGAANKALIGFLAEVFGVPKSAISIELGASGRTKRVEVAGVDDAELSRRLLAPT